MMHSNTAQDSFHDANEVRTYGQLLDYGWSSNKLSIFFLIRSLSSIPRNMITLDKFSDGDTNIKKYKCPDPLMRTRFMYVSVSVSV
ncbi:hypothetical protein NC652_029152 [Populus alba x Populus x berolinensis]|nr:hypothetical protein NC652_029152 [Populus alba x Populus x berolinensis]